MDDCTWITCGSTYCDPQDYYVDPLFQVTEPENFINLSDWNGIPMEFHCELPLLKEQEESKPVESSAPQKQSSSIRWTRQDVSTLVDFLEKPIFSLKCLGRKQMIHLIYEELDGRYTFTQIQNKCYKLKSRDKRYYK